MVRGPPEAGGGVSLKPNTLFFGGLALSVGFVFVPWLALKVGLLAVFAVIDLGLGHRIRFVPALLTSTAILAFNLFPPLGRELGMVWGFPITEGALRLGIERAVTFEGLLLISKATVSKGLVLPGSLGRTISETFRCFGLISGRKTPISFRNSISSIDALMEEIEQARAGTGELPEA